MAEIDRDIESTKALISARAKGSEALMAEIAAQQARDDALAQSISYDQGAVAALTERYQALQQVNQESANLEAIKTSSDDIASLEKMTEALSLEGAARTRRMAESRGKPSHPGKRRSDHPIISSPYSGCRRCRCGPDGL